MLRRSVLLAFFGASLAFPQTAKKLSEAELEKLLEKKDAIFFLDVREPFEIKQFGSVPGYINIPIGELESRLREVPKDKPVITACMMGVRAGRAAAILEKNGYKVLGSCGLMNYKGKKTFDAPKK